MPTENENRRGTANPGIFFNNMLTIISITASAPTIAEKRIDTYTIGVTRPGASLNRDYHVVRVNSYAEAVQEAHELWNLRRQAVTVHYGTDTTYWYHRIAADGISQDRN